MILSSCVGKSIHRRQEAYVRVSAHTRVRSHVKGCVCTCSRRVREREKEHCMHSQVYITCVNTYIHLSISVYICAHEFRNVALRTCLCPVGMSIHVHAYKCVSVCAETPAGMGSSAQMLFSQRPAETWHICIQSTDEEVEGQRKTRLT